MLPSSGRPRAFLAAVVCALIVNTLFAPCLAKDYVQKNITNTPGYRFLPGITSVPAPFPVGPDQEWSGIDGTWSTFSLAVGNPPMVSRVIASTASQQIWVVNHQACVQNMTDGTGKVVEINKFNTDCELSRGYLFNETRSKTWRRKGYYRLWVEKWLGYDGNGLYGFDSVGIGSVGEEGPSAPNTTVGTMVSQNFWLGHLGLHPKPTNFSAFEDPIPSFMMDLFTQKYIPSLSFGYTPGARYHNDMSLGSLTLGGYDASKIIPNDLTFIMSPNNERDLVVGIVGLTANTTSKKNINLLPRDGLNMFIDSTIAEMWFPVEICSLFESTFGLKYDNKTNLYLVDNTLHNSLLAQNASITFTLGQKASTDTTINITLPYAAFDLEASPPYRNILQKTRYFPIRRGTEENQWVLGRAFLQEAYLTVDWERQNFSLSAIDKAFGRTPQLTAIVSPQYAKLEAPRRPKQPLSSSAIIGIALSGGFVFALILITIGWWFWRRRHQRKMEEIKAKYEAEFAAAATAKKDTPENPEEPPVSPIQDNETGTGIFPKAELSGESAVHHELGNGAKEKDHIGINEADNTETQIFEMPGCIPERPEAGGRQLSEKESMVVRERTYNGVDPNTPDASPIMSEPLRRLAPISPSEVTLVNGRLAANTNVSPISPRTPRDGAFLENADTFFQLPPYRLRQEGRTAEDTLLSPISPLEGSTDTSRRRFSYEQ
ncbi:aspartic peptidase domain-containing protein [Phaeosphaeriaceae sp. PMI808]|nr:aspartic peptidase domain-containing protein [Phaeosphaeriaceae sp. PMI808]